MIICGRSDCVYKRDGDACHAPNIHLDANGVCRRYSKSAETQDPTQIEKLLLERQLIVESIDEYDKNWALNAEDVVREITKILEGRKE